MAGNSLIGTPMMIVFTLILSFVGFFAGVTCITLYYYKRGSRRLERLERTQRAAEDREGRWSEKPVIWDVWADKHPKTTSMWNDLLPLNLTYDHDQLSTRLPSLRQNTVLPVLSSRSVGFASLGGTTNAQLRPRDSGDGPHSNPATTECNIAIFISMPTPCEQPPVEFGGEFAIGTAQVVYRHPDRPHS